jgi:hypothetical protein
MICAIEQPVMIVVGALAAWGMPAPLGRTPRKLE